MKALWIDGRRQAETALDRGLQYGDGVFETMAVRDGGVPHLEAHLRRLRAGLERLGIPAPAEGVLRAEVETACAEAAAPAVLKLMVTRGPGGRGYRPPEAPQPRRYLSLAPWPEGIEAGRRHGVRVRWCRTPLGHSPALAGLKHLNRLEQVLACAEWSDPDIAEGLMCDVEGWVVEGTRSNLFVVREGRLYTPRLDRCGVAGLMRARIMAAAQGLGVPVAETRLDRAAVLAAEELFLSNSLIGIWPVRQLAQRRWAVPGPLTRRLQHRLGVAS